MFTITQEAVTLLTNERSSRGAPDTYGVRIFAAMPPERDSPQIALAFVPEPAAGDEVTEHSGLAAFIAPEVANVVGDATLDASATNGGAELVLRS